MCVLCVCICVCKYRHLCVFLRFKPRALNIPDKYFITEFTHPDRLKLVSSENLAADSKAAETDCIILNPKQDIHITYLPSKSQGLLWIERVLESKKVDDKMSLGCSRSATQ